MMNNSPPQTTHRNKNMIPILVVQKNRLGKENTVCENTTHHSYWLCSFMSLWKKMPNEGVYLQKRDQEAENSNRGIANRQGILKSRRFRLQCRPFRRVAQLVRAPP
ncbi:MAG: hypothetical protein LBE33_11635 [Zoogloeaceae bacterium]|nr:hypothetical protein [Zoogloeaceae bacterium]